MKFSLNENFTNEELEAFADVLAHTKIGISAKEATNAFHNIMQRFCNESDAWCECSVDYTFRGNTLAETMNNLSQRYDSLLRSETPETTESPNENTDFDFLEQNAYDKIEPIFDEDASNRIVPLDFG